MTSPHAHTAPSPVPAALAATGLAWALLTAPPPARADEPPLAPATLQHIVITHNGAWTRDISGDETPAQCRQFRLTSARVKALLAAAQPVSERAYAHDLDASRCYTAGRARTPQGLPVRWRIDVEGRMLLQPAGRPAVYLASPDALGATEPASGPQP